MSDRELMKLTPEIEAELRAAINPAYRDQRGTESWERAILLGEIDRLRAAIAEQAEPADVLAEHSGLTDRREWVSVGTWLLPGERVLHVGPDATPRQPQAEQPAQALTDERAAFNARLDHFEWVLREYACGNASRDAVDEARAALASAPRVPRHVAVAAQAVRKQLAEPFPRDELDLDAVRMLADALAAPQPEGGA